MFIFSKETSEITIAETNKVLEVISQIPSTPCSVAESQISVKHNLLPTTTDRKVSNALLDARFTKECYICGATLQIINGKLKDVNDKKEHYDLGYSLLHTWIRS